MFYKTIVTVAALIATLSMSISAQEGSTSMNDVWTLPAPTMSPSDIAPVAPNTHTTKTLSEKEQIQKNAKELGFHGAVTAKAVKLISASAKKAGAETTYLVNKAKWQHQEETLVASGY
jgi:hypothetical protein